MLSQLAIKLISGVIVLVCTLFGYALAYTTKKTKKSTLSICNLFSGVTFLAVCLLHLTPELEHHARDITEYPFEFIIVIVTFLAFWFPHHSHDYSILDDPVQCHQSIIPLVLGLSVHSIVAGISLGMTESATFSLAIALAVHKFTESAAFAISLFNSKQKSAKYALWIFPIFTPIGIGIGILLQHVMPENIYTWVFVVTQAVSVGCFLFVSIIEIMLPEMGATDKKPLRLFVSLLAVAIVALLTLIPHEHNHSHEH